MRGGGPDGMGVAGGAPGINAEVDTGINGTYTLIVMANYDPLAATGTGKAIRQVLSRIAK